MEPAMAPTRTRARDCVGALAASLAARGASTGRRPTGAWRQQRTEAAQLRGLGDWCVSPRKLVCAPRKLRHAPPLVGGAAAAPYLELGAVGGASVGVIEALARCRVDELPFGRLPLLVGAAVAGPQLDLRAIVEVGAGDVEAAAVDGDGAVGVDGPVL